MRYLEFGLPYAGVAVAGLLFPSVDRIAVTTVLGLSALGAYAIAARLGGAMSLVVLAFQTAWGPFALSGYRDADVASKYSRAFLAYALAGGYLLWMLGAVAPIAITTISAGKAPDGEFVVVLLGASAVLDGASGITGIGIDLSKRTVWAIVTYLLGVAAAAAAVWVLVHPFGLIGVATGIMIGKYVQLMASVVAGRRLYPLVIATGRPGIIFVASGLAALMAVVAARHGGLIGWASVAASGVGFTILVWRVILSRDERRQIARFCRAMP